MRIESSAFKNAGTIPIKFTCDGKKINPPLMFMDVPKKAKSLALIMDDIDVPVSSRSDGLWNHWLVWNMPATTKGIGEGTVPPGIQGHTTGGRTEYQSPCLSAAAEEHRYYFRLYALDIVLSVDTEETRRSELLKAMKGRILAQAELMGKYARQQ
jgi:Raf kinase inhibitor-like YbhB/YbcL family protein